MVNKVTYEEENDTELENFDDGFSKESEKNRRREKMQKKKDEKIRRNYSEYE